MPSLGQSFSFGFYELPVAARMRAIRDAGFDDVMLWWGDEYSEADGAPREVFESAVKAGLRVRTAHFPTVETPGLWREGAAGDAYERALIEALRTSGERGIEHLVVHVTKGFETPPPNETGLRRMLHAVEAAEKYDVDIALENTRFLRYNQYLYDHVDSDRMRFCFDCGHANCYTPDEDPLGRFGDRFATMHLHDNRGALAGDEHMMPGYGSIDFVRLSARLAELSPEAYNLESCYSARDEQQNLSMEEYLARSHAALKLLVRGALKRDIA
ncbi:MAG: sugar phosphate isomerase/epimerase [Clostridiales bacterium]|nr:sugar phosphate isomerase/epimerase [Clostridiales bacterium]